MAITQCSGLTKIDQVHTSETYVDNKEFNGNAVDQFQQAFSYIRTRLPVKGSVNVETGARRDYLPRVKSRIASYSMLPPLVF